MTVTAAFTSFPAVTDPRDGTPAVTGGAVNATAGLLLEGAGSILDEGGAPIFDEAGH